MTDTKTRVLVPAEMSGKVANSDRRYGDVPLYRTGETWLHRVHVHTTALHLVKASDGSVHGPFGSLDDASRYVGRNGGGYLDWGSSASMIPDRGIEGQMSLLHKANGLPWWGWQRCEESPRAYLGCGHQHTTEGL